MESYEKAYKAMVQRARELHEGGNALTKLQMEIVCPELAESEDERVNEEIRNFLIDMECKREWIAYLEKHKDCCGKTLIRDSGESACSYMERCLTPEMRKVWYEACAEKEKQKEQKPIISAEESLGISQEEYNKIVDECIFGEQKEQKLIEWSDSFEENIRILLHDKLTWHSADGKMSSTVFIDDKTLKDVINGIWFYVGKEALKYPNKELNATEWCEDDEIIRDSIIEYINSGNIYATSKVNMITWLKSLRPPFKDREMKLKILKYLSTRCSSLEFEEVETYLNNLRPHWKPSETQMWALQAIINDANNAGAESCQLAVKSLYDDLKKL